MTMYIPKVFALFFQCWLENYERVNRAQVYLALKRKMKYCFHYVLVKETWYIWIWEFPPFRHALHSNGLNHDGCGGFCNIENKAVDAPPYRDKIFTDKINQIAFNLLFSFYVDGVCTFILQRGVWNIHVSYIWKWFLKYLFLDLYTPALIRSFIM